MPTKEVNGVKKFSHVGPLHSLPGMRLKRYRRMPPQAGQMGFGNASLGLIIARSVRQSLIFCRLARIRSRRWGRETAQLLLMKP